MIRIRSYLSVALILALAFNPLLIETAVWAQDTTSTVNDAKTKVDTGDQQVQATKEIDLGWFASAVLSVSDFLTGSDYKKQIKEANQAIRDSKTQSTEAKTETAAATTEHSGARAAGAGMQATLEATSKAKAVLQNALKTIGNKLLKIATTVEDIGKLLVSASSALSGVPGIGVFMSLITTAGKVIVGVARVLKAAGEALIKAADKAMAGDQVFIDAISAAGEAFMEGYKNGGVLATAAKSAASAVENAAAGASTWTDMLKAGLETAGEIGKTASAYIDKGKSVVTNVWNTGKKIWSGVTDFFGFGKSSASEARGTTGTAGNSDAAVSSESSEGSDGAVSSESSEGSDGADTGVEDDSTSPESSDESDSTFIGGSGN